jgi:hypothetical protein
MVEDGSGRGCKRMMDGRGHHETGTVIIGRDLSVSYEIVIDDEGRHG